MAATKVRLFTGYGSHNKWGYAQDDSHKSEAMHRFSNRIYCYVAEIMLQVFLGLVTFTKATICKKKKKIK